MGQPNARTFGELTRPDNEGVFDIPETLKLRNSAPAVYLPPSIGDHKTRADSLVHLPKVIVLVDGDEVADAGWPGYPLPVRRKSLVDNIALLCLRTGAAAQVIFDAGMSRRCPHSRRDQSVEVRLAASMVSPAAAIGELITRHSSNRPLVVVSSDPKLSHEGNHRAEPVAVVDLLDLFLL